MYFPLRRRPRRSRAVIGDRVLGLVGRGVFEVLRQGNNIKGAFAKHITDRTEHRFPLRDVDISVATDS